jgi:hypothetical protein
MTPEELLQLRLYALRLREMVAREERLGTERSRLPSWKDTKRLLLDWADELDQEANEADRQTSRP